jgi:hypothetical protein
LGDWSGKAQTYRIPQTTDEGLRDAVLVQTGSGGAIIAAARD